MTEPEVGVPRDVFVVWARWLAEGQPGRVAADLADLLDKTRPAVDPPSTPSGPAITTR